MPNLLSHGNTHLRRPARTAANFEHRGICTVTYLEHLGVRRRVIVTNERPSQLVSLSDTTLVLFVAAPLAAEASSVLARWQEREARRYLTARVRALSEKTGLTARRLSFRRQRSRWGSCNHCGDVSLNLGLMALPPELIDYVIIHELSHTKHMNHSKAFWREVQCHCPYAKRLDKALRKKRHP